MSCSSHGHHMRFPASVLQETKHWSDGRFVTQEGLRAHNRSRWLDMERWLLATLRIFACAQAVDPLFNVMPLMKLLPNRGRLYREIKQCIKMLNPALNRDINQSQLIRRCLARYIILNSVLHKFSYVHVLFSNASYLAPLRSFEYTYL